jgi:type IV pilus assembly protein PilM
MNEIVRKIEDLRKEELEDGLVLEKIMESLPEKRDAFEMAINRGATATQILNKILEDNREVVEEEDLQENIEEVFHDEDVINKEDDVSQLENDEDSLAEEEQVEEVFHDEEGEDYSKNKGGSFSQKLRRSLAGVKGSHFFSEFFAITRYLLVGIDISDHSVEILLLDKDGSITSYGRSILEEGIVSSGDVLDQKRLTDSLRDALRKTKPHPLEIPEHTMEKKVTLRKKNHKAIVSLPEAKTYIHIFEFDDKNNLYAKIEEKIKNTIPFEYDDLYWDFKEISSKKRGVKVLCVAAQRDTVDTYIHFFKSANVDPVAFDVEGASIGRALLPVKTIYENKKKKKGKEVMADGKSRMIVDLGARTTTISIFNEDAELALSVPLPYAGRYFTKKIADELKLPEKEANELRKKEGFDPAGKTYAILKPHGKKIVAEIKEACKYYKRQFDSDVKEILLAGGTSLLPGIVDFFNSEIKEIEVKMGEPLKRINDLGMLSYKESILFANVVGLARRALLNDPIRDAINLLPEEVKNQERRSQVEKHRSVLLVAVFIAISGILFLGLAAYYLIYLPVPAPIQPLKQRILLHLEEKPGEETIDVAVIREELEGPAYVRRGPGEEQEIIGEAIPGKRYKATGQLAGWVRIVFEDTEGWIHGGNLEKIETVPFLEEEATEGENPLPENEEGATLEEEIIESLPDIE